MSNTKSRLHRMLNTPSFLRSEVVPYASVEVIRDGDLTDTMLNALGVVKGSRRTFAARCAQELATEHGVPFSLWESEAHAFRTLPQTETPGLGWARIQDFQPMDPQVVYDLSHTDPRR